MHVWVLGPRLRVEDDRGHPVEISRLQVRRLLTLLALDAGRPIPAATLTERLWPEGGDPANSLKQAVHLARRSLPPGTLHTEGGAYRLDVEGYLDVREFRGLAEQARLLHDQRPAEAIGMAHRALALWGSPPLGDMPDSPAAEQERHALLGERRELREELAEMLLDAGRHRELARMGPAWLNDDPFNEHLAGHVMLATYRSNRKIEALRIYEALRDELSPTLPGIWLQRIAEQIGEDGHHVQWRQRPREPSPEAVAERLGIDTTTATPARIYDYLLGGRQNFEADRRAVRTLLHGAPHVRDLARQNRALLRRAVRVLAKRGVRRFLEIGSGLPTVDSVHQVAQRVTPDARVVYVDNDPLVHQHASELLRGTPSAALVDADMRVPAGIVDAPETRALLDTSEPVAVLLLVALEFLDDVEAEDLIDVLLAAVPSGSHLVVSHTTTTGSDPRALAAVREASSQANAAVYPRSAEEIAAFFTGTELLPPGVVDAVNWGTGTPVPVSELRVLAGVGRKP
ncbi:MAG TPA: SAM-dependent methyltransferase [Thermomonospora sp.]|nr:SAM-dependent methyltransferase [Thermomonospora sp.]